MYYHRVDESSRTTGPVKAAASSVGNERSLAAQRSGHEPSVGTTVWQTSVKLQATKLSVGIVVVVVVEMGYYDR